MGYLLVTESGWSFCWLTWRGQLSVGGKVFRHSLRNRSLIHWITQRSHLWVIKRRWVFKTVFIFMCHLRIFRILFVIEVGDFDLRCLWCWLVSNFIEAFLHRKYIFFKSRVMWHNYLLGRQVKDLVVEIVLIIAHQHSFTADWLKFWVSHLLVYVLIRLAPKNSKMWYTWLPKVPNFKWCSIVADRSYNWSVCKKHHGTTGQVPKREGHTRLDHHWSGFGGDGLVSTLSKPVFVEGCVQL